MSAPTTAAPPAVLAVLVAHDGVAWLPRVLDALEAQSYVALELVAVDNASVDGSRELLLDRLGEAQVLIADRDLGFGGAVSMALDARPAADAPYILLVHDDLDLAPDAVATLVAAMERDPRLAITGPKLLAWDGPDRLQSVGATIDLTGRVDTGVESGELDQGQHDQQRPTLYVSTAGMLVRRGTFDELGRFDRRYHVFRDDLDLCWRAWIAGHDVEVVPLATATHAAGAANYLRLGQTRFLGPRYFDERNTLATLLKNYAASRLLLVLPLYALVGAAKIVGFLLTRRFSDAWQTVRAWIWNLTHLADSRRARRQVQAHRVRGDAELTELFGRLTPRIRAYAEAMASWVAGGDVPSAALSDDDAARATEPDPLRARLVGLVRRRPVALSAGLLSLLVVAGTWPLLLPGELRGGQLAPWPADATAFLRDHVQGWHEAAAFGTAAAPSPVQALAGLFQLLLGGSTYLASRAVLLLPLAVAWLLALRAVQPFSRRRPSRVIAATAYVLSPPSLAALVTGRLDALVILAILPGLLAGLVSATRPATRPSQAWRAVAGVVLLAAVAGAVEPLLLPALVVVGAVVAVATVARAKDLVWRTALLSRLGVMVLGPLLLLLPWSLTLLAPQGPILGRPTAAELAGDELWAWLLLSPSLVGFPGVLAGVGFLLAGLLGLALGWRHHPLRVLLLWGAALLGATLAWWADRSGSGMWAGTPLLVTAGAFSGAFAVAYADGARQLVRHAFGWRQIGALVTAGAVALSVASVGVALVREPFATFVVDDPGLPSFVLSEAAGGVAFRVLVLTAEDGEVAWEVVDGTGPTMAAMGLRQPPAAVDAVRRAVGDLLEGRDPGAADRLGRLGIRYVRVPEGGGDPGLTGALDRQLGLEPRPVAAGELRQVSAWLPRAVALTATQVAQLDSRGALDPGTELVELTAAGGGRFTGILAEPGSVLLAEAADPGWILEVDGERFEPVDTTPVRFDELPAGSVELRHAAATTRPLLLWGQGLLLLLVISLMLRPPGIARRVSARQEEQEA